MEGHVPRTYYGYPDGQSGRPGPSGLYGASVDAASAEPFRTTKTAGGGAALGVLNSRASGGVSVGARGGKGSWAPRTIMCGQRTLTCEGCEAPIVMGALMRYGKRKFVCDRDECEEEAARRHKARVEEESSSGARVVLGVATGVPVGRREATASWLKSSQRPTLSTRIAWTRC